MQRRQRVGEVPLDGAPCLGAALDQLLEAVRRLGRLHSLGERASFAAEVAIRWERCVVDQSLCRHDGGGNPAIRAAS
jgi:hypothetical protein